MSDVIPKFSATEEQLQRFLAVLLRDAAPGRFVDVRWRRPAGPMRRRFVPSAKPAEVVALAEHLSPRNDVYVGVAMRDGDTHGGRASLSGCSLVWVESDDPATAQRLLSFEHPPTVAVASGTPGHLQLYWRLDGRCGPDELELLNRRLAIALVGDPGSSDAARVLRLPGTLNHKHHPPSAVSLLACRPGAIYSPAQLSDGLPSLPARSRDVPRANAPRHLRSMLDRELLAIGAAEYVKRLTGRSANRDGKLLCPFHDDNDPSLQLYPDGGFFCFGSGCRRGGTIFDFASHLWGIAPRGVGFLELRVRLAREFGLERTDSQQMVPSAVRAGALDLPQAVSR